MPRVILSPSGNAPVVSSAKISFKMEWFVVRGRLLAGKDRGVQKRGWYLGVNQKIRP